MNSKKNTPLRRQPSLRLRPLAAVACAILCALLVARAVPGGAQAPTPAPSTPPPVPGTPSGGQLSIGTESPEIIPTNEDPLDPAATPEQRLQRQKNVIMKRIQMRQKMLDEKQRQADDEERRKYAEDQLAAQKREGAQNAALMAARAANPNATPTPVPPPSVVENLNRKTPTFVTMFLAPAAINTRPGVKFSTLCSLLNPDHLAVDAVELHISYPAWAIKLVGVHQDKLLPLLSSEPECHVDEKAGTIVFKAKFAQINRTMDVTLLTFVWQATATIDEAKIKLSIGDQNSTVFSGKRIINSARWGQIDTLMGATVHIENPQGDKPRQDRFLELGNHELMASGFPDQRKLRPPTLWMNQPDGQTLAPGTWLVVDLGINNPDHCVFDEVRLAANYDPQAVEIVDSDRGNWVREGTNLLDGPFHKAWPWDNLYSNYADNKRGVFYYRMGMNDQREQPSGTVARVFVHVKRAIQSPIFSWVWASGPDPSEPGSGIYLFNRNLYRRLLKMAGNQEDPNQGRMPTYDLAPSMEKADPAVYRQ